MILPPPSDPWLEIVLPIVAATGIGAFAVWIGVRYARKITPPAPKDPQP